MGTSPVPQVEGKLMTFSEAVKEIVIGRKVHKLEWKDKDYYGFLNGGILSLHKPDGKNYHWLVNDGDINGEDYVVV